jgi:hypothetical protein
MNPNESIPADIKRFILASIDSVPHLEVALMLRKNPALEWDAKSMAGRLFINEKKVELALADLSAAGFSVLVNKAGPSYRYQPVTAELKTMMDQLAEIYPKNLIEITNLIHSKINKQAQQFGDAFKLQDGKE